MSTQTNDHKQILEPDLTISSRETWYFKIYGPVEKQAKEILKELKNRVSGQLKEHFGSFQENDSPRISLLPYAYILPHQVHKEENHNGIASLLIENINDKNRDALISLVKDIRTYRLPDTASRAELTSTLYDSIVRAAQAPNWGGGGPGGIPIKPTENPTQRVNDKTSPYYFNFKSPSSVSLEDFRCIDLGEENVDIIIFDTCPSKRAWECVVNKFKNNELLQSLNSKLTLHPNRVTCQDQKVIDQKVAEHHLDSHRMVSHGIFVAGIIHSIAPHANIQLFGVLDDHGRGTRTTIEFTFVNIVGSYSGDIVPLIVNCSFAFGLVDEAKKRDVLSDLERTWQATLYDNNNHHKRITLVASAAGNEGTYREREIPDSPPIEEDLSLDKSPYPLFPAGYTSTIGVSALKKGENPTRADYANWADDWDLEPDPIGLNVPPSLSKRRGIATLGGDIQGSEPRITDETDSILGLYIDDYYPCTDELTQFYKEENKDGWARWAGTSFATSIATGVLALLAANRFENDNDSNSNQVLEDLWNYCSNRMKIPKTSGMGDEDGEHILDVTQGPQP